MRRYLIHHDGGRTWDLVVTAAGWAVEYVSPQKTQTFPLKEFEASSIGKQHADMLWDAIGRALEHEKQPRA